jgi:hypothetical protein
VLFSFNPHTSGFKIVRHLQPSLMFASMVKAHHSGVPSGVTL